MEGLPEDLWSPFKYVQKQLQRILLNKSDSCVAELEGCLKKCKQSFASLLKNPPKNEEHRKQLLTGKNEGLLVVANRNLVISKDLVDESLILSDMFDLDEIVALELLCTAQRQMNQHPGLPRGLVAILLYYDGRKAITQILRDLFQATSGVTWISDAPQEIISTVSQFTQSLVDDFDILKKILDALVDFDFSKENLLLTKNRALGTKKHQNQVKELFEDIRINLAMALFNWSAQRGLPQAIVANLLQNLSRYTPSEPSGSLDNVTLILLMALFYSYDVCVLNRQENEDISVRRLPIFNEPQFLNKIYEELKNSEKDNFFLGSVIKFSFGIALTNMRHIPAVLQDNLPLVDRDEDLIDQAIASQVFYFFYNHIFEKQLIYRNEFFYRQFHNLFTNFIDLMNSKITELRGKADESAKAILTFSKEGIDPPLNLDRNFEYFLLCIAKLYKDNKANLALCTEYWGPLEVSSSKINARSISLFKFIRLSGELLPSTLFVPYLKMISALASCEQSARSAFNFLKQTSGLSGSSTLSWEHFFQSLNRYYGNLRDDQFGMNDTIYRSRAPGRLISPNEIDGLISVLEVVKAVTTYDGMSRLAIGENLSWNFINTLIGLLSCSVPLILKAEIMHTLAALAKSKETATVIWNKIEGSQIISTIPSINSFMSSNIIEDINQNEVRMETYPLTKGVLDLFYTLIKTLIPRNLGGGQRKPGLNPYMDFLINGVFLKFYNRNYKAAVEKWDICEKSLKIFEYCLKTYDCSVTDFDDTQDHDPHPGYHIMIQTQTKSDFLRLLLLIIDDFCCVFDEYNTFTGKQKLQDCAYYALNILQNSLYKQDLFFEAFSSANGGVMVFGLNKILLDINPRSGRPDHIMNILKFVTYWSWLPFQALFAIKILIMVSRNNTSTNQIIGVNKTNDKEHLEIRQAFVENLESELVCASHFENHYDESFNKVSVDLLIKEAIIQLLQESLQHPGPSIPHFLLGIENNMSEKSFFNISDGNSNCMKALVFLLDSYISTSREEENFNTECEKIIEQGYNLLYLLCSNNWTSESMLRYLRSSNDFLSRHLFHLASKKLKKPVIIFQVGHVLKCLAIELKYTARNCQISRFQQLGEFLTGTSGKNNNFIFPVELVNYRSQNNLFTGNSTNIKESENKINILCQILYGIDIDNNLVKQPKWEFFDTSLTKQALTDCEIKSAHGHKIINIKRLHDILYSELGYIQSSIASSQHKFIVNEIQSVLKFAIEVNTEKTRQFASIKALEAWGQVTEILFSCAPELAISTSIKKELTLDILQNLLAKVLPSQPSFDMAILASETVLLLLVNLRSCFIRDFSPKEASDHTSLQNISLDANFAEAISKSNSVGLKYVLKNVLEWILLSGVSSQKLRINLYSALLSCLQILKANNSGTEIENQSSLLFHLNKSIEKKSFFSEDSSQHSLVMEVFFSYGDKLIEIISTDAVSSHDICKMLAFSCLDTILDMELIPGTLHFIVSRGYLTQIVESLKNTDENLCKMMCNISENLKTFYLYESKMCMLLRIANTQFGAEVILSNNVLYTLSNMNVFDMHPDLQGSMNQMTNDSNPFLPAIDARFRQILFPALNLCNGVLSTLGPGNHSVISQIMHFLFSHSDMIEVILRNASPDMNLCVLEEVSGLTNLIARTFNQELYIHSIQPGNSDVHGNLLKIHRLMLLNLDKFIVNEQTLKRMAKDDVSYDLTESNRNIHVKYVLEIAANLSLYCRNAIANHSADHILNQPIFSPALPDLTQRNEKKSSFKRNGQSITVVLAQIRGCVDYFSSQKSVIDHIIQQRNAVASISFNQNSVGSYRNLSELYLQKNNELSICAFIAEQCLYLLWSHLDLFMRHVAAKRTDENFIEIEKGQHLDSFCDITVEEMGNLRKSLISLFNETFCKQLLEISEYSASENMGFNEVLIRRIKHMTQLV